LQVRSEHRQVQDRCTDVSKQLTDSKAQLRACRDETVALNKSLVSLQAEHDRLSAELSNSVARAQALAHEVAGKADQLRSKISIISKMETERDALQSQWKAEADRMHADAKVTAARASVLEVHSKELDRVKAEYEQFRLRAEKLSQALAAAKKMIKDKEYGPRPFHPLPLCAMCGAPCCALTCAAGRVQR
jgi:cell division septum initiation protein DivIVA